MNSTAFILDVFDSIECLPWKIGPNLVLRRAISSEISSFKELLLANTAPGWGPVTQHCDRYERSWKENDGGYPGSYSGELLSEDAQRYYVVEGSHSDVMALHFSSLISRAPLDLSGLVMHQNKGHGGRPLVLLHHFWTPLAKRRFSLNQQDLEDLSTAYHLYASRLEDEAKYRPLHDAIQMLDLLYLSQWFEHSEILSLFAIIEMLISHNPKLEDRGDSISHQISTKMPLLFLKAKLPLDLGSYFPGVSATTVWKSLYALRSAYAHGGKPDFANKLKLLKDATTVRKFLGESARLVLRGAFEEPEFFEALKAC